MNFNYPIEHPHSMTAEEVVESLQTDPVTGLSAGEAAKRTEKFGPNIYEARAQKSLWLILLLQFKSPLVYLLLFASAVTLYFQDYIESGAIMAVILINAVIGFLMEVQARNSMKALKEMDVILCKVIRDGKKIEIPSEQITVGDVIEPEAGDVIPGDARLIECNALQCEESSLTGESLPTEKNTDALPEATALGDRVNMVFKGTSVMNGYGKAIITGIAGHTQLGTITSLVDTAEEQETPLDRRIAKLSTKLIWVTLIMIALFAAGGVIQGKKLLLILETSIALAVAAFPEGLPIVATVALAYGTLLMAKRNAIVKKLSSVETLGSTNVILTDKTGTLTENKIYVDTFCFPGETVKVKIENQKLQFEKGSSIKSETGFEKLRLIGALCNNALIKESGEKNELLGDPIEIALIQLANATDTPADELKNRYKRIDEVPFNSDDKIMATLHTGPEGEFVAAKGSVEHLLALCTRLYTGSGTQEMSEGEKEKILADSEQMAAEGLRVLAFAYREESGINRNDYVNNLVYVALIGFLDPPRLDIKDAILACRNAGIKVVMITGDHPLTALNIARKVGLVDTDEQDTLTGLDIPTQESLTDEWRQKILSTAVFARTTPQQKLDIVAVYQNAGNIVAMTGDGVNDAPALKKADIGIAMGLRGTSVAKETANIVLKDDSFTSIAHAVAHGRQIFQNIQKFVIYLVSCNLSEIFVVTALGFIAPATTLLPLQILFLNMVTDVFPALALGVGKGDPTVMEKAPRKAEDPIVSNKDWGSIIIYSLTMSAAVVAVIFYCSYVMNTDDKIGNNAAFLTLAFAQLFHVFNMSSPGSNFLINDITKNKFVWWALLICILLIAAVYLLPGMGQVLGLHTIPVEVWAATVVGGMLPVIMVTAYKSVKKLF